MIDGTDKELSKKFGDWWHHCTENDITPFTDFIFEEFDSILNEEGEELADLVCEYFACKAGGGDLWEWVRLYYDELAKAITTHEGKY